MTSRAVQWIGFALLVFFLSFDVARAASDGHDSEYEAYAHCVAGFNEGWETTSGQHRFANNFKCNKLGNAYSCIYDLRPVSNPSSYSQWPCDGGPDGGPSAGHPSIHNFTTPHSCDVGDEITSSQPYSVGGDGSIDFTPQVEACFGGCVYEDSGAPLTSESCYFTDSNGNGISDPGESGFCDILYSSSGATCSFDGSDPSDPPPLPDQESPGEDDVPCFTDLPGGCGPDQNPFPSDPNDPGNDPDDPVDPGDDTGDNEGTGDGDPDTPGDGPGGDADDSTGTGDGDTDGDDEREVDCNPLSNPDCAFRGSGSSSNACDTAPSCSGDPVQCTILKQEWQAMCYPYRENGTTVPDEYLEPITDVEDSEFFRQRTDEIDVQDYLTLDDSGYLGGGSCPADESVSLGPLGTFVVPWGPFCQVAEWLGYLVMIMASIVALRVFMGGFS